jgi:hypothetical protein
MNKRDMQVTDNTDSHNNSEGAIREEGRKQMGEMEIPVLTQPCNDHWLHPLGAIAAEGASAEAFAEQFASLKRALIKKAPPGTIAIYNLRYEYRAIHGHKFLRGTADAYGKQY